MRRFELDIVEGGRRRALIVYANDESAAMVQALKGCARSCFGIRELGPVESERGECEYGPGWNGGA